MIQCRLYCKGHTTGVLTICHAQCYTSPPTLYYCDVSKLRSHRIEKTMMNTFVHVSSVSQECSCVNAQHAQPAALHLLKQYVENREDTPRSLSTRRDMHYASCRRSIGPRTTAYASRVKPAGAGQSFWLDMGLYGCTCARHAALHWILCISSCWTRTYFGTRWVFRLGISIQRASHVASTCNSGFARHKLRTNSGQQECQLKMARPEPVIGSTALTSFRESATFDHVKKIIRGHIPESLHASTASICLSESAATRRWRRSYTLGSSSLD